MSRMKDILLRLEMIFSPIILPIIYVLEIIIILYENFKHIVKDVLNLTKELIDFTPTLFIKNWFELLYYAIFDWEINSVNKPRIAKLEQKIKEMKEKDFEK